jgi:hypothetical protein
MNDEQPTQIDADKWSSMTFDELIRQKSVLLRRYEIAIAGKKPQMASAMIEGLNKIDVCIQSKT